MNEIANSLRSKSQEPDFLDTHFVWLLRDLVSPNQVSKESFKEFVDADGLNLFFDAWKRILKRAETETANGAETETADDTATYCRLSWIFDCLNVWIDVTVSSFDHTLGDLPLLIYFLSERDNYSIDLAWVWRDATRLSTFINMMIRSLNILVARKVADENSSILLLHGCEILSFCLSTFPPFRVTPLAYAALAEIDGLLASLNAKAFNELEASRTEETTSGSSPSSSGSPSSSSPSLSLLSVTMRLLTSITLFGIGPSVSSMVSSMAGCVAMQRSLIGERCACNFCELSRRTLKAIVSRDELGVEASYDIASNTASKLIKPHSGIHLLLDGLTHHFKIVTEISMQTETSLEMAAEKSTFEEVWKDRLLQRLIPSLFILYKSPYLAQYSQEGDLTFTKLIKALVAALDHLHSKASRKDGPSSPADFDLNKGGFGPGYRDLICFSSYLLTRHQSEDRAVKDESSVNMTSLLREPLMKLLILTSSKIQSDFPAIGCEWFTPLSGLVMALRDEIGDEDKIPLAKSVLMLSETFVNIVQDEMRTAKLKQTESKTKSSENSSAADVKLGFDLPLSSIAFTVSILCGAFEYLSTKDEKRRLVLPPADASAAFLLSAARDLLKLSEDDKTCGFVKTLLKTGAKRAEQASALMPAQEDGDEWVHV